jgi:hypothetical protein
MCASNDADGLLNFQNFQSRRLTWSGVDVTVKFPSVFSTSHAQPAETPSAVAENCFFACSRLPNAASVLRSAYDLHQAAVVEHSSASLTTEHSRPAARWMQCFQHVSAITGAFQVRLPMAVCSSCDGPLLLDALPMVVKNSCMQK